MPKVIEFQNKIGQKNKCAVWVTIMGGLAIGEQNEYGFSPYFVLDKEDLPKMLEAIGEALTDSYKEAEYWKQCYEDKSKELGKLEAKIEVERHKNKE